jgi:hypothetical protein
MGTMTADEIIAAFNARVEKEGWNVFGLLAFALSDVR